MPWRRLSPVILIKGTDRHRPYSGLCRAVATEFRIIAIETKRPEIDGQEI